MSDQKKNYDPATVAKIAQRVAAYNLGDAREQHKLLTEKWREQHPLAAAEAPSYLKSLIPMDVSIWGGKQRPEDPDETWHNDTYSVTVRRHKKDPVFDSKGGMVQLGISSFDGTARHDWRDFQAIKNQLAGEECEAFELYPAESRLLDPSNYYTLWCFPSINRIKVGMPNRRVFTADEAFAPQRDFQVKP